MNNLCPGRDVHKDSVDCEDGGKQAFAGLLKSGQLSPEPETNADSRVRFLNLNPE